MHSVPANERDLQLSVFHSLKSIEVADALMHIFPCPPEVVLVQSNYLGWNVCSKNLSI